MLRLLAPCIQSRSAQAKLYFSGFSKLNGNPAFVTFPTPVFMALRSSLTIMTMGVLTLLLMSCWSFVKAEPVTAFEPTGFSRTNGAPVTEKRTFFTEHLNGDFVLTVYNGGLEDDETIGSFVSSSTITLNGAVVVGPHNFNQNTDVVNVPVILASVNELSVQLQGKPGGVVTVEITGNVNNAPFADAGVNQTVKVGDSVTLDGSASFDDDGDALNYRWALIAKPSASLATLTASDSVSATFTADVEGNYVAGLVVNDGQLDSAQSQVSIRALKPNIAPVLEPIDNVSAPLGSTLTLDLSASDGDGDALRFSALDLPLPPGASLDAASGRFVFKPDVNEIGVHELTFTVSDGRASDQQTVTITVPGIDEGAPTRFRGRLLDANDYQQGIVTPIVGATVSFLNNGPAVLSDSQGYFAISNLTAGTQVLNINSATAQDSPAGGPYAGFREQYPLIAHVENNVARPFYLPRIDRDSLTQVDPAVETVVANPNLGVSFAVPPYTAKNPDGSYFTGQLSISEVPKDLAPAVMPETIDPGLLVTIQPVGITFTEPVALTFPNIDNLDPGNEVDIWSVDPEMGAFVIVGTGLVSADGQSIQTISGGVSTTDWHSVLPPEADNASQAPGNHVSPCDQDQTATNSTLTTQSGCLNSGFSLPAYTSQGKRRSLSFSYRSSRAWPNPAIPFNATISRRSAVPPKISHQAIIGGVRQNNPSYISTSGFSESVDETLRAVSLLDASSLATGIYPYNIQVTNHFAISSRSATLSDSMVVVNEQASPFGAGWGIAGVSRLQQNNDGRVLIYDGNGKQDVFDRVRVNLDLNQWRQQGPSSAGRWQVSGDGLSVLQTINGQPTFFVGPDNQINTTITGRFRVETSFDDDFIGFVFGYQSPQSANGDNSNDYEFLLFDWKRRYQSGAQEGFTLSKMTGGNANLWGHTGANLEVLASQYGSGLGWRPNTDYRYELVYSDNRIVIRIDGVTVFDVAGSFAPGKFGFYNYSQARVRYSHFITTSDYEASEGDYSTLAANDDGSFTRTLKNGTQIRFNAEGLQTDVIDRNGNRTHYDYNSQRRLTTITDPVDLQTVFTYTGGRLDTVTDPAGRVTRFRFDNDNNLIQATFPDGTFKRFGYDHRHLMTTEANERGFTGVREYHGNGRLKQVTRADGSLHQANHEQIIGLIDADSTFGSADNPAPVVRPEAAISVFTDGEGHSKYSNTDSFGRLIRRTDANNLTTVIERDADGNPVRTHRPDQLSHIERVFDEAGNTVSVTESYNNAVTRYSYDPVFNLLSTVTEPNQMALDAGQRKSTRYVRNPANGNLETLINALGHETHFDYNSAGQVVEITEPNGLLTTYHYNVQGLPDTITEIPPSGGGLNRVTTLTYHADGQVKTLTTPDRITLTMSYDPRSRLISISDPLHQRIEYQYDDAGNPTRINSINDDGSLAATVAQGFDALNRLRSTVQPHISGRDSVQQNGYDKADNLALAINANGQPTDFDYDPGNRLIKSIDARLGVTDYAYDDNGHLKQVIAPNGAQTDYEVDPLGRIRKEISPDRGVIDYRYDLNNNLIEATDARGVSISYEYDGLNRLTAIHYPDAGEDVVLSYDNCAFGIGRLCQISDEAGVSQLAYDAYGNLTALTENRDGTGYGQSFQYDAGHRLIAHGLPTGRIIYYDRDSLGRVERITTTVGGVSQIVLDHIAYDANNRIIGRDFGNGLSESRRYDLQNRLVSKNLGGGQNSVFSYDANSNLLTRNVTGDSHAYQYDELDRLNNEANNGAEIGYQYDENGNRLLRNEGNQTSVYDITLGSNQLEAIDNQLLTYDAAGHLIRDTQGRSFVYNNAGRLTAIQQNGVTAAEYFYKSNGLRSHKIIGAAVTLYHYDRLGNLISETNADGSAQKDYVWLGNEPVAQIDSTASGETLYYLHTDHLNTPRLATDASQIVTWRWESQAFGDSQPKNFGATVNLRFPGQYFDVESGLYYNWHRYYDPVVGRYITSDLMGLNGGLNNYIYVLNNPLTFSDLNGLVPIEGVGTPSKGTTGNPISGGEVIRTPKEQIANKVLSKIIEKLSNKIIKIDPPTGRLVPNPGGIATIGLLPKDTAKCQTLSCDLNGDGLDDNALENGLCKPGFN